MRGNCSQFLGVQNTILSIWVRLEKVSHKIYVIELTLVNRRIIFRLSDASGFSEFSFPLEDAVSLNTGKVF